MAKTIREWLHINGARAKSIGKMVYNIDPESGEMTYNPDGSVFVMHRSPSWECISCHKSKEHL